MGDTMEYLLWEFPDEPEQWGGTFDDVGTFWLAGLIRDDYDGPLSEYEAIQWRSARRRLRVAMIPESCHGRNLRTMRPAAWQSIRRAVLSRDKRTCRICGHRDFWQMHAHEVWDFTPGRQTLVDVVTVCADCHDIIHIGHTLKEIARSERPASDRDRLCSHFCRVNGEPESAFDDELAAGYARLHRLNATAAPGGRSLDMAWADSLLADRNREPVSRLDANPKGH